MKKAEEDLESRKEKVKKFEQLKGFLKKKKEPTGALKTFAAEKGCPKTLDACTAKIEKLKEQIGQKEFAIKNKEDNKSVALGTSKINYMDPRITISWCKQKEVPIEKIFQKTLQSKFAWAMNNEPKWEF